MGNSDLVRGGTSETNDRVGFLSVIFYPGKDRFSYIVVGDLGRNAFRIKGLVKHRIGNASVFPHQNFSSPYFFVISSAALYISPHPRVMKRSPG